MLYTTRIWKVADRKYYLEKGSTEADREVPNEIEKYQSRLQSADKNLTVSIAPYQHQHVVVAWSCKWMDNRWVP